MEEVQVSVYCLVYNHERYLRRCLDGFVMQRTNFGFEVFVHDDASTDGSPQIIQEYAEKYPEIIKPIFQKENQYSQHIRIMDTFIYSRMQGKYIALCEGDDYWSDPQKLQRQYDYMESHPNCSLAVHKVQCIDEAGNIIGKSYPREIYESTLFTGDEVIMYILKKDGNLFQFSSFFRRKSITDKRRRENPDFFHDISFGDIPSLLYCAVNGDIYYDMHSMSCYRVESNGSWSTTIGKNKKKVLEENKLMLNRFDTFTGGKYHGLIEYAILKKEFYTLQVTKQYREQLQKRYKTFFKQLTWKEKLYVYLHAFR